MHPTVWPVALVTDAIQDCSKRDDITLDAPLPAPKPYPHPADILLDPVRREVHILRPQNEEKVPIYRVKALIRD